jgi:hypothetical protein
MNISVTVQTPASEKSVFARGRRSSKRVKIGIRLGRMSRRIMTALTKEWHPSNQKLSMMTSMNLVAIYAVLRNRGMLKGVGSSLFCMAFVTKLVH